jgi:peptide/nickel transport system substrate-binding protein
MKKSSFIVLTLLIIFSLNLLVIADEIELKDPWFSEKPQGVYGGTLITSEFGTGPRTFNTILAKETSSTAIINNYVFEGLVGIDAITTELIPELARDWEVADDGKTWTFYLRRGVQWSDGIEFTADDVIFTLDVISEIGKSL